MEEPTLEVSNSRYLLSRRIEEYVSRFVAFKKFFAISWSALTDNTYSGSADIGPWPYV